MKQFIDLHDEYLTKQDKYFVCEKCEQKTHEDDYILFDGQTICRSCYMELPICSNCKNTVSENTCYLTEDDYFCDEDCYEEWKLLREPVGTE